MFLFNIVLTLETMFHRSLSTLAGFALVILSAQSVLSLSLSLSLRFNGHFPGEPGLAGAY